MLSENELSFDYYLNEYRARGVLRGKNEFDVYFHCQAEYQHAIAVTQAVNDLHQNAGMLAQKFRGRDCEVQLNFGLSRRSKFIWRSLQELLRHASPLRKEPMTIDDSEWVAMRLNEIYINLRGCLDNLAWALVDIFDCGPVAPNKRTIVNLFNPKFPVHDRSPATKQISIDFNKWNRELSDRRDPAAHRIPLIVPTAIHSVESMVELERINAEANQLWLDAQDAGGDLVRVNNALEKIDKKYAAIEKLGEFKPAFTHHPNEKSEWLYPTMPNDAAALVKIANKVFAIIRQRCNEASGLETKSP